ncbi:MAG: acetyl-CoA carboxylase biotin carboxylase subunit, partial [Campylobacter lanienae]|nr:acetyl-CoA carboxylase biotin carboxylase subunit [Campylobacter lanienae]
YTNAGTIEFLLDDYNNFYFMEMNTRIQVEHGVTEEIVGVDLISRQIRIASGEILDIEQTEVKPQGVAIEARITAENVWKNFTPSPGKITGYFPALGPGVRVDSHMYQGYSIPPFYDSLVAKLIVKARSYDLAVSKLERALDEFTIEGVRTTLPFLLAISKRRHFRRGFFDTSYIEERLQDILENTHDSNQENKEEVIAAIAAAIQKVKSSRENG